MPELTPETLKDTCEPVPPTSEAQGVASTCPLCAEPAIVRLAVKPLKGRLWYVAKCRSCKLVFTDPQPNESDISSFYEGDYHSALREPGANEKVFGEKFESYCDWLLRYVEPGRSLDIGCATGLFVKYLQDRGFQAEGYEANELSAEWARSQYGVTVHVGILDPRSLPPKSYDLISLCDVLEHTLNPLEYLKDLRGPLRPGGHVMVTFPHVWAAESLYYRAISKLVRRDWIWGTCKVPTHTWEFTPETAQRVFEQAGFRIVAFRRRQDRSTEPVRMRSLVDLIHIPPRLLQLRPFGDRFGIQMHFLLQVQ
jgi:2-polyprenyl-3-methyl-5-hydroxy-6-metoxy-1,4-benzoquinol methylase